MDLVKCLTCNKLMLKDSKILGSCKSCASKIWRGLCVGSNQKAVLLTNDKCSSCNENGIQLKSSMPNSVVEFNPLFILSQRSN